MDYILAIDQGTHASRALIFDDRGARIAAHLEPIDLTRPQADRVEQDGAQILNSINSCLDKTLRALTADQRKHIAACGLTTQRSTVLAWLANGEPCSPALSWQDTRGQPQIERLQDKAARIRSLSGLPLSAHYGASKLHWLSQSPDNAQAARLGPLAAFLLDNLLADKSDEIDHSNAQRMQLMAVDSGDWSDELLDTFGVDRVRLPVCCPVEHHYGALHCGIPVTAVCGDQNAAWFAEGPTDKACARVNIGSGAFVLAARNNQHKHPRLLTSIASSTARAIEYLTEGTVNGAGSALTWLQRNHSMPDIRTHLSNWLENTGDPPLFLNTVGGLGSPWWVSGLPPVFYPDKADHSAAQRAVAVVESILFLLQVNLDQLQAQQSLTHLRVSGGLSRVDPLCRKLANLCGLPVVRSDNQEASARGIAWLAAGRPAHWSSDALEQLFQPETDNALRRRYHHFSEQLVRYIEDANRD